MKTQHTPGPWCLCNDFTLKTVDIDESYYWTRIYSESDADIAPARAYGETIVEAKANARLIAAAPELLEAMEYINKQIDKVFGYDLPEDIDGLMRGISDAVDEAITKAKGE